MIIFPPPARRLVGLVPKSRDYHRRSAQPSRCRLPAATAIRKLDCTALHCAARPSSDAADAAVLAVPGQRRIRSRTRDEGRERQPSRCAERAGLAGWIEANQSIRKASKLCLPFHFSPQSLRQSAWELKETRRVKALFPAHSIHPDVVVHILLRTPLAAPFRTGRRTA